MPYILQADRQQILNQSIEKLKHKIASFNKDEVEGAMNYSITSLLEAIPGASDSPVWKYRFINRAIGVLECVKLEFYRRLAAPYEDRAIKKNGDIPMYEEMNE